MLRRCVVFMLVLVTTIQGIYDPSDEVQPTKTLHFHHNYSKVNVQRAIYNAHTYGQRPAQQEIERLTQNGDLVRIKRNKTKIEIYSKCPKSATGQFVYELSCNQYLNCWKGRGFVQNCAPGTLFNPKALECDHAEKVQCVTGPRQSMLLHHHEKLTEETQPGCPEGFSGIIPHYTDCAKFINCDRGKENVMDCAPGTLFDVNSNSCDHPQKAQCVNQQGGYRRRVENGYGDENAYGGVGTNHQRSSSGQNQKFSSSSHQGQRYRPGHNVGIGYQGNVNGLGHNLEAYEQHLESSYSDSRRGYQGQGYRPVHNVQTTYEGQSQYDQNLDSYNQNGQSTYGGGQNTFGYKGRGHHNHHQASSSNYGQGEYEQNLEEYDQNLESSSPNWLRSPRPVHNVTTTYAEQGQYEQNLEGADTHRAPRYRPIQNVATLRRDSSQDQNSESFSSYARGHQINAYSPTHNIKTGYDDQDQESSNFHQGLYSQNQQLASASNVHEEAHPSPKCPQDSAGLYAHPYDCSKFLNCANGITYIQECGPGTLFNPLLKVCDFPYNVQCPNRRVATDHGSSSAVDSYDQQSGGFNPPSSSTRRPVNVYASRRPQSNEQGFYEQQNRNYQHRPVQESGGNIPYSSTIRPAGFYISKRPQTNIDRHQQTVYEQENRNYGHRPVQESADNIPYSSTIRPAGYYTSKHPQSNIDRQTVYEQENRNCGHRPVQESADNIPYSSTIRPVGYYTSRRPQTTIDRHQQTVYDQKNHQHRPAQEGGDVPYSSTRRPVSRQQGNIDRYEQTVYEQQNKNYEHRPARQNPHREQGVSIQLHQQTWIPVAADDAPQSTTSKPFGYVTKKPEDNERTYETPDVDYIYEYDDDIIVDTQPAASNRKPQGSVCRGGQFACPPNKCITNLAICDGFHDCVDGSDESNCDLNKFTSTRNNKLAVAEKKKIANTTAMGCAKYCLDEIGFECRAFNYRKHDDVCYLLDRNIGLSGALIIYPIFDYYEMVSKTINCTNLFNCPNNKCVAYSKLCDGLDDCGDRSDEKHCSAHVLGYSVRLSGAPSKNEGRIEVSAMGKTGFVCDDNFGMRDAEVVCKELGFALGALEVKGNSYYAKEIVNNTFYMMDDVGCLGNESSLRDCDFNGWGVHNCMGQEVVGVVCKTPEEKCKEGFWQCDNEQECIPVGFLCDGVYDCTDSSDEEESHCDAPIQLRLANGSTHLEGRVEIKYLDTWGTICDDDFNEDAAKVVCQYFGFQGSASVRKNGFFGGGKGPIWLDQVFCQGNESSLQECVHWDWGEHNCDHSEDVGVVCSESAYVDGTERRRKEEVVEPPRVEPLQLLPERCGLRKDSIFTRDDEVHFRVVKGSEAKKGDYPWQASIRVKGKSKPTHWCGAVVISQRFVLTAAHCLQGFSKGAYIVVAGDYHVDEDEGSEQVALIEDFFLHEDFRKGQKMNNDIALVKLKGNGFRITDDVQPICLPDSTTPYRNDMNCTISGFGSTKSGKAFYSHALRAGWLPLQSRDICKMPHIYGGSITEGMICAGFLDEGVDACDGDSGGPLACLYEGVFTLFGITSWGQHCGYANKPGVYVKVGYYRDWIEEKMRQYA